jgi:hypothetical protein
LRPPSPLRNTVSVSQSSFDSTTSSEQGSYGGTATDSSGYAGNGSQATADGIRSTGALDTASATDNGLLSVQGTDSLGDTVVATDNWTVYEAGSWGGLS